MDGPSTSGRVAILRIGPRTASHTLEPRRLSPLSTWNGEHGGRSMRGEAAEARRLVSVRVQDRLQPLVAPNPEVSQGLGNRPELPRRRLRQCKVAEGLTHGRSVPVRTPVLSSRKGTSPGRWSRFSTVQSPRGRASSYRAEPCAAGIEVMPWKILRLVVPCWGGCVLLITRKACSTATRVQLSFLGTVTDQLLLKCRMPFTVISTSTMCR